LPVPLALLSTVDPTLAFLDFAPISTCWRGVFAGDVCQPFWATGAPHFSVPPKLTGQEKRTPPFFGSGFPHLSVLTGWTDQKTEHHGRFPPLLADGFNGPLIHDSPSCCRYFFFLFRFLFPLSRLGSLFPPPPLNHPFGFPDFFSRFCAQARHLVTWILTAGTVFSCYQSCPNLNPMTFGSPG